MLKAIIIDDEQHCIERLKTLLQDFCAGSVKVTGTFQSVDEGAAAIENLKPELVFLDVELNRQTGFDLLRKLKQVDFEIIFTTAYDKYAVQAFRFSAIDYLLKPIDAGDLQQAVDKAGKKKPAEEMLKRFDSLLHNVTGQHESKKIMVPTSKGFELLELSDIIRCESNINYTILFLKNRQKIVVAKTLKEFEELLESYHFYRVHNSHLVNLHCIKAYKKGRGGVVVMSDSSEIEVSTRRKEEFLRKLGQL